ncbi:MAG: hypothetical protein JSW65_06865 [Candidatus Bipolaricaulota bacterium]|nr:MAG: hypothetical protein JSW65_06865 [Candidatus Bipolaricaulota bacterium]
MRRFPTLAMVLVVGLPLALSLPVSAKTPMKALISGVPRYYQAEMRIGGSCWFPTGCGPVAGASICAWWDKRGFPNLIDDTELQSDGLPQQAIIDLGAAHYMNRDTSCAKSWVLPGNFQDGLEDYMNDHLGTRADVARFEVFRYRITGDGYEMPDTGHTGTYDELFEIVREEIWNGRPMVYLFRWEGEQNNDDTFKVADHYGVVVGYDQTDGSRRLVIQANQSTETYSAVTGYQNVYIGSNRYLRLGDHTKGSAVVKYHLYAIRPIPSSSVEIGLGADPLLLDDTRVDNTAYHRDSDDGVATAWFEPKLDQFDVFLERLWHDHDDWGKTDEIVLQDGICFVAGWRTAAAAQTSNDADGDGIADEYDKPDFQPVYVRTHVDSVSGTQKKLTLYVELRNLGQSREPYYGQVDVHWEHVQDAGPMSIRRPGSSSSSGSQAAVAPLYPESSTEVVSMSGQSTERLEHSWAVDADDWEASDTFSDPLILTVDVDPDDDVDELDDSNNGLEIALGSWSVDVGLSGIQALDVEIQLSPRVMDRLGPLRLRAWQPHSVDASILGDADFTAVNVPHERLDEFAQALANADQGDLFAVLIQEADVLLLDVAH